MAKKSVCPITRHQFWEKAEAVKMTLNGQELIVPTKEFSSGSLGWYYNGKATVMIDGVAVQVQLGLTLTIVGSKELPPDPNATPAPAPPAPPATLDQPQS